VASTEEESLAVEYITSRGSVLPESPEEFATGVCFNMWARRLWPYRELERGGVLFWYESPSTAIVWKSLVDQVIRFGYDTKGVVESRLTREFGYVDTEQPYFEDGPEKGYCVAYKVMPLQRLNLPKPTDFTFPRQGWLRIDVLVAAEWIGQTIALGLDITLDDLAPAGALGESLQQ